MAKEHEICSHFSLQAALVRKADPGGTWVHLAELLRISPP